MAETAKEDVMVAVAEACHALVRGRLRRKNAGIELTAGAWLEMRDRVAALEKRFGVKIRAQGVDGDDVLSVWISTP